MPFTKKQKERIMLAIEALESGEYKQQRDGGLLIDGKYCCLGVFSDVYRKKAKKGHWVKHKHKKSEFCSSKLNQSATYLTPEVKKWFGFDSMDPNIPINRIYNEASYYNDNKELTFKQIAKGFRRLIEKDYK